MLSGLQEMWIQFPVLSFFSVRQNISSQRAACQTGCLLMPWVEEETGSGLRISKGGTQGQDPVIKIENKIKKKRPRISLRRVQTGVMSPAPGEITAGCPRER